MCVPTMRRGLWYMTRTFMESSRISISHSRPLANFFQVPNLAIFRSFCILLYVKKSRMIKININISYFTRNFLTSFVCIYLKKRKKRIKKVYFQNFYVIFNINYIFYFRTEPSQHFWYHIFLILLIAFLVIYCFYNIICVIFLKINFDV